MNAVKMTDLEESLNQLEDFVCDRAITEAQARTCISNIRRACLQERSPRVDEILSDMGRSIAPLAKSSNNPRTLERARIAERQLLESVQKLRRLLGLEF